MLAGRFEGDEPAGEVEWAGSSDRLLAASRAQVKLVCAGCCWPPVQWQVAARSPVQHQIHMSHKLLVT